MFKVLEGPKRRISPAAMAASIAAHLLLLGGAAYAAANDTGPVKSAPEPDTMIVFVPLSPPPAPPVIEPASPSGPQQAGPPDATAPGEALGVAEVTVPDSIRREAPGVKPVDVKAYERDGRRGSTIGTPAGIRALSRGDITPLSPWTPDPEDVEEQPVLNREGLARTMERYYPSALRDSRVAGHVVVALVVDEDGRVREGSARVLETTHPAFAEATLRAVEQFRFSPAKMMGVPVPVRVTIPINWTVPQ